MKKKLFAKRAASLVMASAMTLSLAMFTPFTAFAEDEADYDLTTDDAAVVDTPATVAADGFTPQDSYTLTIDGEDKTAERYTAYQIFKGTLDNQGRLGSIQWGDAIATTQIEDLLNALKANTWATHTNADQTTLDIAGEFTAIASKYSAKKPNDSAGLVAALLAKLDGDETNLLKFAAVVRSYATANGKTTDNKGQVELDAGYYLIVDKGNPSKNGEAISPFILKFVDDTEIHVKSEVPTVNKKITDVTSEGKTAKEGASDTAVAAVGDTVSFELTGTLPTNLSKYYDFYYYQFYDEVNKAFTIDKDSITVKIDLGDNIVNGTSEFILYDADSATNKLASGWGLVLPDHKNAKSDGTYEDGNFSAGYFDAKYTGGKNGVLTLEDANLVVVTFSDLLNNFKIATGTNGALEGKLSYDAIDWSQIKIIVTYDAVLNDKAVVGDPGNENTVQLVYSNDPNVGKGGDNYVPDEDTPPPPDPDDPGDPDDPWDPENPDDPANKKKRKRYPEDPKDPPPPYNPDEPWNPDPENPDDPEPNPDPNGKKNRRKHKTKTPEKTVYVYTFAIDILKTSAIDATARLSGAQFQVSNKTTGKTAVFYNDGTKYTFVGYLDTDQTVTEFNTANAADLKVILGDDYVSTDLTTTVVTNAAGKLLVSGLAEGTYTVTETQAPDGYTIAQDSFDVTLEGVKDDGDYTGSLVTGTNNAAIGTTVTDKVSFNGQTNGQADITVFNNPMSILPDTGGNGIYFYYGGGVAFLLMGAAALMISKKKFGTNRMV